MDHIIWSTYESRKISIFGEKSLKVANIIFAIFMGLVLKSVKETNLNPDNEFPTLNYKFLSYDNTTRLWHIL